jgi:hypothetical protein
MKAPKVLDGYKVTKFVPFDPVGKRTEGQVTDAKGQGLAVLRRRNPGTREPQGGSARHLINNEVE